LELHLVERAIEPIAAQQVGVGTRLRDTPAVNNDDPVGAMYRAEPVSDHERSPASHEAVERALDQVLTCSVE
jgi:hypothetical protein